MKSERKGKKLLQVEFFAPIATHKKYKEEEREASKAKRKTTS
jgi:hypothetical protein